ncbi:hypothetical protein [Enorma phocaeensis]|uniref:Uncharacterized protein n=1 Tax=Enorma phocaeensis TaxID=1871019 RepID=A0ABT7V6P6_9ACTN|nr:hypothetical protein [Enorma phocaeensis]MDM8274167.1 hypothetical protein [Enorma phocaeensis]
MDSTFPMTTSQRNSAKATEAVFEVRLSEAAGRGIADIEMGRYVTLSNRAC